MAAKWSVAMATIRLAIEEWKRVLREEDPNASPPGENVARASEAILNSISEVLDDYEATKPQTLYTEEARRRIKGADYVDDRRSVGGNDSGWEPERVRRPGWVYADGEA